MGNKVLRPSELDPFAAFNDDQISYLQDKFEILCDEHKLLVSEKIADAFKTPQEQALKILNYIDFEGQGEVDFYEFTCAAASLHQNDDEAEQFLFQLFAVRKQLDKNSFELLFKTVFGYLHFLNLIQEDYSAEVADKKFTQYDYNKNDGISFDQFKSMLKNDYHCRLWMEELGLAEPRPKQQVEKPINEENDEFLLEEEAGDEAGSAASWVRTAEYMAPQNFEAPDMSNPPSTNLDIGYVYGYRCYDTRDNLRYNSKGEIVYHTAGCGIVLNQHKNTMRVTTVHNDDISCLDSNFHKNLVATGQLGRKPSLVVWDSNTLETKAIFKNKLEKSISTVAISKSGKYVAATSMNDNHQIAVYDINKGSLVAFGRGPRSVVYSIKFNAAEDEVVCACAKQVVFAKFTSGKVQCKKGIFGKAPLKPNLCIALLGDAVITSMNNGVLAYWKGHSCSRVYKEHNKAVGALCQRTEGGIISGDILGNIILWSANMSKERQFSLAKLILPEISNHPRVISLYQVNNHILVGTRGGEIVEIDKNSARIVMEGHFDGQLWGLCVSGNRREFYTGGHDKLLMKWDADKRVKIMKKKLDYPINSLDINRAGVIAVGHRNGVVNLFGCNRLDHLKRICDVRKNPDKDVISYVKFSPDGSILAVAYCPPISKVYLYDEKGNRIGQCKGSPSRILSIDFSRDSSAIMINNTSYEILFYNAQNGSQIGSATSFRGEEWATMNARFSWHTQGIWPPCSDGSDINAVDRSNSKKYLVTADDFSKVKMFKYPVCVKKQIYNSYKGHSSHVTGIKWMWDDRFIVSTGGLEKSVIQWLADDQPQLVYDYEEEEEKEEEIKHDEQYEYDMEEDEKKIQGEEDEFGLQVDEGDQGMAVKPFLGQVKHSTPNQFKTLRMKTEPKEDLQIKHVWGIRNQYLKDRVRDQLRYSSNYNSCFYITAALGVEHHIGSKKQKYYSGQSQDLISFAMTKDRKYCATGQMAQLNKKNPRAKIVEVHVWDAETKQRKAKLGGFHQRAVVIVEFSPSGKRLLTVGQDDKNSLAAYDWEIGRIAWKSPVCGAKVTGAAWKNEKQYMTVGLKHVKMWNGQKGTMCKVPGKWDPMVSVVYWNSKFVSGGSKGDIYLWSGSTGIQCKGHEGRVDCLAVNTNDQLFSGDDTGLVIKWKYSGGKLIPDQKVFHMSEIDTLSPGVLSLDFSPDAYLVCTNSSSIYEVPKNGKAQDSKVVMQSHYIDELWAESWSPDSKRFVTGGDDKTVRMYDIATYEMISILPMKERIRGLDWEKKEGELIVIGDYKGKIYLCDEKLSILDQAKTRFSKTKPRREPFWIEDIKFSPNGEFVAFGAHGGASHLELFQVKDKKLQPYKVIKSLITSALLTVDWSQDSDNLAIVSQAYELQFTNHDGRVNASAMKDVKWATWSGKFGACVQQIHQDVDYSNINAVCVSPSRSLVATGGDDQKIRLFSYPVIEPKQKNKQFIGHSSHVTRVRFSRNQAYLLSEGGNDRTIILWEVAGGEKIEEMEEEEKEEKEENEDENYEGLEDAEMIMVPRAREERKIEVKEQMNEDEFGLEEDEGDQFMAVKPWVGAIKQPTIPYYKGQGKAPKAELILQYAHGYRTKDCRNNLKYLSSEQICYHTAGLGVVMDVSSRPHSQTFFDKHSDDIISMAWDSSRSSMFTGQMGAKPIIYQWSRQGSMIQQFKGAKKGVSAVAANEQFLIAAGLDDNHYVYLFSVGSGKLLGSEKGGRDVIIDMKWVDEDNFISIGVKHYKYWTVNGKSMKGKSGLFGKNCNILCCLEVREGKAFVGASDGSLQIWSGNSCEKRIKAHDKKAIHAICLTRNVILTGSSDETVKLFTIDSHQLITTIKCQNLISNSHHLSIRAIDVFQNKLLIGTLGSQIYELVCSEAIDNCTEAAEFRLKANHMNGHYAPNYVTNQVWGLGVYDDRYYATCSDDGTLRLWDLKQKQQVQSVSLCVDGHLKKMKGTSTMKFLPDSVKGRCMTISREKDFVIGCKDGTLRIISHNLKHRYCQRISKKQISHVKFSPDGTILAVGSHDCRIYLYRWNEGTPKLFSKRIKHNSYIKHFDFSRDGNIIHSTCGGYELLFWDASTGKQITSGASSTRDQEWATWNVTLGWPVQGIFQQYMDGTDINAVDRSKQTYDKGMKLLASGDDRGKVRLLEYPCLVKNSQGVVGRGHSSHVTNVEFNLDDQYLLSTGGEDQTILQWQVQAEL